MTQDEALQKFKDARDKLISQRTSDPTATPAGQAFVGQGPLTPDPPLPDLSEKGTNVTDIAQTLSDIAAGMAGGSKASKLVAALPIPEKYKLPAEVVARFAGSGTAAGASDMTWSELRRHLGDPDAPDSL